MAGKLKIIAIGAQDDDSARKLEELRLGFELVRVRSEQEAIDLVRQGGVTAIVGMAPRVVDDSSKTLLPIRSGMILQELPDGVVVLDIGHVICWANKRFSEIAERSDVAGKKFYDVLGDAQLLGPDYCPFHMALVTSQPVQSRIKVGDKRFFELHVAPVTSEDAPTRYLVVLVREISNEVLQQQKLTAIHEAGKKLIEYTAQEYLDMSVEERVELLKKDILHFTQCVLNYNVIEIRLLDPTTHELTPLLYEGMDQIAADRKLVAGKTDNGITGWVAATGESYLCEDTLEDELYVVGFEGARSSMTAPLILNEQVIGTFNVESPTPRAFNDNDLMFLDLFARDVAGALNTLELMAAESQRNARHGIEAVHRAVAMPIDQILRDTVNLLEDYPGHDPEVEQRLKSILASAREIRLAIQKVGQQLIPVDAIVPQVQEDPSQRFLGRRFLVVDADPGIVNDAHALLETYGAIVEGAPSGEEAIKLVRTAAAECPYHIVISDTKLPDMGGHKLMFELKNFMARVPMILMQGYGWDPGHAIVKAREQGLHAKALLFKPFRKEQLLEVIATMLEYYGRP